MPRDLASIVNCLFCDSYFLFTVHEIDLKDFRRKQGKAVLLDLYEEVSARLNRSGFPYMPCPMCQTLRYEMKYKEWLGSDHPCTLSPCRYIKFDDEEEDVPIYEGEAGTKKWQLVHGLAPKGLNLDKSRGMIIYKNSLKEWFKPDLYDRESAQESHEYMSHTMFKLLSSLPHDLCTQYFQSVVAKRPLFEAFHDVVADLEDIIMVEMSKVSLSASSFSSPSPSSSSSSSAAAAQAPSDADGYSSLRSRVEERQRGSKRRRKKGKAIKGGKGGKNKNKNKDQQGNAREEVSDTGPGSDMFGSNKRSRRHYHDDDFSAFMTSDDDNAVTRADLREIDCADDGGGRGAPDSDE